LSQPLTASKRTSALQMIARGSSDPPEAQTSGRSLTFEYRSLFVATVAESGCLDGVACHPFSNPSAKRPQNKIGGAQNTKLPNEPKKLLKTKESDSRCSYF
jgi:hypothetical protein